jgi:hypothetical protein
VVGAAHEGANLLEVDHEGHVAAFAGELPLPGELAVERQADDGRRPASSCRRRARRLGLLLETARRKTVRVWAEQSPFELKDSLKRRGY